MIEIAFGPSAEVALTNISPNCEEITQSGSFSSAWWAEADGDDRTRIGGLDHAQISEGETVTVPLSKSIIVPLDSRLCVFSTGTEEDDPWDDDEFDTEGEDCRPASSEGPVSFVLDMYRGTCRLKATIPGVFELP